MVDILSCTSLTELTLTANFNMEAGSFLPLLEHKLPLLQKLVLTACDTLGNEDVAAIAKGCPILSKLDLEGTLSFLLFFLVLSFFFPRFVLFPLFFSYLMTNRLCGCH